MAAVYSAIVDANNSDYWDGTIAWGYDGASDKNNPTPHPNEAARDAQYGARVYNTLSDAEASRDGDAQAGDDEYFIIQGPWDVADGGNPVFNFTNAVNSYVIRAIGTARADSGVYSAIADGPYRLVSAQAGSGLLILSTGGGEVDGIQAYNTEAVDTSNAVIFNNDAGPGPIIHDNIIISENAEGVHLDHASITAQIWNNIIYCPDHGGQEGIYLNSVDTAAVYNNTVHGFDDGVEVDAVVTSAAIKNNIVFENTTDFDDAVGVTIDYNASDDGTGNNPQTPSGADWANEMSNYANDDFELDAAGNCYDNAETNPGAGLYLDDITGTTRTVSWSIGAWEYDVAGGIAPTGTFFGPLGGPFRGVL